MDQDNQSFQMLILQLEEEGRVTRTFRRLDTERQQAVVSAILMEAAEVGAQNINIKRVAARAGVALGSLYQYFGDRERMLDFALQISTRRMIALFAESEPYLAEMTLRDGLRMYLSYGVEWTQEQAAYIRLFTRAAYEGDVTLKDRLVTPVAEAMREVVMNMLRQAVFRGEVRADIDLEATARVINTCTVVLGDSQVLPHLNHYFQVTDDQINFSRILDAYISLIMDGIGLSKEEE